MILLRDPAKQACASVPRQRLSSNALASPKAASSCVVGKQEPSKSRGNPFGINKPWQCTFILVDGPQAHGKLTIGF
jgi:hypothetical protein